MDAITDNVVNIRRKSDSLGLPRPKLKFTNEINSDKWLGCGHYGCVLSTDDPKQVLKITTDESEAKFALISNIIRAKNFSLPGVVTYFGVIKAPDLTDEIPLYLLFRDAVNIIGMDAVDMHLLNSGVSNNELGSFVANRETYHSYSSEAYSFYKDAEEIFHAGSRKFAAWLSEAGSRMGAMCEKVHEDPYADISRDTIQEGFLYSLCQAFYAVDAMESDDRSISYPIGKTLNTLYQRFGIVLGDVNEGNIGLIHEQGHPVITDPGHMFMLDARWDGILAKMDRL